jgi:hypothetical protein
VEPWVLEAIVTGDHFFDGKSKTEITSFRALNTKINWPAILLFYWEP